MLALFSTHFLSNYNRINEWPLQFLRTGVYYRSYGLLASRTTDGAWWSGTAGSVTDGRNLGTWPGNVRAQDNPFRGFGIALRCVGSLYRNTQVGLVAVSKKNVRDYGDG